MTEKKQQIRIIAGIYKGHRLPVLDIDGLRPTKDAIRETLFSWLMPHLKQAKCLDLFAGTGVLGFEAISRGADEVTLIEKHTAAAEQLLRNRDALEIANISVHNVAAEQYICNHKIEKAFDIVFLDPPFNLDDIDQLIVKLINVSFVSSDSLIYIEQDKSKGLPTLPRNWVYHRKKKMGQVVYGIAICNGN